MDLFSRFRDRLKAQNTTRQFKRGEWGPEIMREAARLKNERPTTKNRHQWLQIHRATDRIDPKALGEIVDWPVSYGETSNAALNALMASVFLDKNQQDRASEIASLMVETQFSELSKNPHLLSLIEDTTGLPDKKQLHIERAKQLMLRTRKFDSWISDRKPQSISVVGNAPTETGKGSGSAIDEADCVIRFNRVIIDSERIRDYGQKTDIWAVSPAFPLRSMQKPPASTIVVSGHYPFHRSSNYWQDFAQLKQVEFLYFSHEYWLELVARLNAPPSSGLLSLYTLLHDSSRQSVQVNAFGFTRDYKPEGQNHYGDTARRSSRHNWSTEARLVGELLDSAD